MICIEPSNNSKIFYKYDPDARGITPDGKVWEGIVIAFMDECTYDAIKEISHTLQANFHSIYNIITIPGSEMKSSYKGIAKCSIEDKFNLELGKKIAREKMLSKYYHDKYEAGAKIVDCWNARLNKAQIQLKKYYREACDYNSALYNDINNK